MKHVAHLQAAEPDLPESSITRVTGKFHTDQRVAKHLIEAMIRLARPKIEHGTEVLVLDPFAGDGRLIRWLLEAWAANDLPRVKWQGALWDLDDEALANPEALECFRNLSELAD